MNGPSLRPLVLLFGDESGNEPDRATDVAARLAAALALELRTCFVEDRALLDVAELPFTRRFVQNHPSALELSPTLVRATWRRTAERCRAATERAANAHRLAWTFGVVQRRSAPEAGELIVFAGRGASARAAELNLRVVADDTPQSTRALELARSLTQRDAPERWLWSDDDRGAVALRARARREGVDLLIVPSKHPLLAELLDARDRPLPCDVLAVG